MFRPLHRRSILTAPFRRITALVLVLPGVLAMSVPAWANIPGGGTGAGANVTVTNNGDGSVTMANGVVSLACRNQRRFHQPDQLYLQ
jgi:hypothetical protein